MNELLPVSLKKTDNNYLKISGWEGIRSRYHAYLQDESRLESAPIEVIHFPGTTAQVASALASARQTKHRVTVSGGRTGIVGGAAPLGAEELISLERLKFTPRVRRDQTGNWVVRVAAGTTLQELTQTLDQRRFQCEGELPQFPLFYPVDTTERSAQIGGTVATNASGARTFFYGPTRDWVQSITIVTPDARILCLKRGQARAEAGTLEYRDEKGNLKRLDLPDLPIPPTKHTTGYPLRSDMDAVDLFIGCEGTLGIITEVELKLIPKPRNRLSLTLFPQEEAQVLALVSACVEHPEHHLLALEYIGPRALDLLRTRGSASGVGMEVSRLPQWAKTALYAEFVFEGEEELNALYQHLTTLLDAHGIDAEASWAGFTESTMTEMKNLRHAVPETVNAIIAERKRKLPGLYKVGTDMAVPSKALKTIMRLYRRELDGLKLDYLIFGHIGDGHLHVNILPETIEQLQQARSIYMEFAHQAVKLGGSVAGEHGIGRIKKPFLALQYSEQQLQAMRDVKRALDPDTVLNPGVLFDHD